MTSSLRAPTARLTRLLCVTLLSAPVTLVGPSAGSTPTPTTTPDAAVITASLPKVTVTAASLTRTRVQVSGVQTAPVSITVSAVIPGNRERIITALAEQIVHDGLPIAARPVPLALVSGTTQKGTWRGVLNVTGPSRTFAVFAVQACDPRREECPDEQNATKLTLPRITVRSTHEPELSITTRPSPVPLTARSYVLSGRLTDSATGRGLPRVPVLVARGMACFTDRRQGTVTTDAAGRFRVRMANRARAGQLPPVTDYSCAQVLSAATDVLGERELIVTAEGPPKWSAAVSVSAPAVVRRSAPIVVKGSTRGLFQVQLQRLRGASQWRTVSSAEVRSSGRFTLSTPAATLGRGFYRVTGYTLDGSGVSRTIRIVTVR